MSLTRRHLLSSMLGSAAAAATTGCGSPPNRITGADAPAPEPSLDAIASLKGLRFGSAVGSLSAWRQAPGLDGARYRNLVARECGLVVPENALKWPALRPSADRFDFNDADALLAWAQQQGLAMRGHTLLWQGARWFPSWLNRHDFGSQPVTESERLLSEHIGTVCRHYGSTIASWDVLNEAVSHETGQLRDNAFTPHLGNPGQIELVFRLAHEHAPHAQLVYNDYMGWGSASGLHRAGVLRLLHGLRARQVPVHALGLQSHLAVAVERDSVSTSGQREREWRAFLDEVTAMGLDLLITELDVNDRQMPADTVLRDVEVAAQARDYLDLTLSYPRLRTVMVWGLADPVSWLQRWQPRPDGLDKRPTPYDAALRPKPLRKVLAQAFRSMPSRAAAS